MPTILADMVESNNVVCRVFPFLNNIDYFGFRSLCRGEELSSGTVVSRGWNLVQTISGLIFVAIIIIAIFVIIRAAIKYIRSEGDETKIQEAQKAIKSVFIGLVALFVGVIGLVLILVIFNALGAVGTVTPEEIDNQIQNPGTGNQS